MSPTNAFSIAAANSLLEEMRLFLDDGVDIDATASWLEFHRTGIRSANGLIRSVSFWLDNGANIDKRSYPVTNGRGVTAQAAKSTTLFSSRPSDPHRYMFRLRDDCKRAPSSGGND